MNERDSEVGRRIYERWRTLDSNARNVAGTIAVFGLICMTVVVVAFFWTVAYVVTH